MLGEETQQSLHKRGIKADIVPKKYCMESLAEEFEKIDLKNKRVFIPHSKQGRKFLAQALDAQGAKVNEMAVYDMRLPKMARAAELEKIIKKEGFRLILFTSSSCVHNFMKLLKRKKTLLNSLKFASIGPVTDKTLREYGYRSNVVAGMFTTDGLIKSILGKRRILNND